MKKTIMALLAAALTFPAMAQTEFRALSHDEAVETAKKEGKLVFFDFYTTWCGPCKMMAKNVFPQKEVGDYFNEKFVCVKLDAEKDDEGKPFMEKYNVAAFPTFVVVDPKDGSILYNKAGGNFDGKAFVEQIKVGITPELSPERMAARYASGERTPQLISAYANNKLETARQTRNQETRQAELAEACRIIDEYWDALPEEKRLAEENSFCYDVSFLGEELDSRKCIFAMRNRERFETTAKAYVSQQIEYFVDNVVAGYLSGNTPCTPESVKTLNAFIAEHSLDSNGRYTAACTLIGVYAEGNEIRYIDACEKHFKRLNESQQQTLLMNFAELIKSGDKDVLSRADKFVRRQLATLDATTVYFASFSLMSFQKRLSGEDDGH